jgi:hypothetical protein
MSPCGIFSEKESSNFFWPRYNYLSETDLFIKDKIDELLYCDKLYGRAGSVAGDQVFTRSFWR